MDLKQTALAPVRFVKRHKVAVTVVVTSAFWIYVIDQSNKGVNEFLEEKGLTNEFYTPEPEPTEV